MLEMTDEKDNLGGEIVADGAEDDMENDADNSVEDSQAESTSRSFMDGISDFISRQRHGESNSRTFYNEVDCSYDEDGEVEEYPYEQDSTDYDAPENDFPGRADLEAELCYLRSRNKELEEQARHLCQLLSLDNYLADDMNFPLALVVVPDNPQSRYYKEVIEDFLCNLPPVQESKLRREKKADEYRPMYQHSSFNLYSLLKSSDPRSSKIKMIYNSFVAFGDYLLDACGQPLVEFQPALTDGWIIPTFAQPWNLTIGDPDKPSESKKFQMTCFNCGGDHTLRECTQKRDLVRINQNRQALIERFGAAPGLAAKSTRYHLEVSEVDKRFAKFSAGRISQELREALGLHRKSLPMFVYRMRQLGYPPGWLREAELEKSGLGFISDKQQLVEDGEVNDELTTEVDDKQKEVTYNLDKLISYPGFNSKIPEGIRDECNKMRTPMPPMQKHQQLTAWCKFLSKDATPVTANGSLKRASDAMFDENGVLISNGYGVDPKRQRCDDGVEIDMDICENEPVMPIIEGDLNAPFRGFIPPPPDEEDDESLILKPMPPPIMISDWWLTSIQTFVNGDDFVSSVRSKGKVRTKPQVTGIILNEDGEVINDQETTDDDEGSVPIMFDNPKNGNAGDDDDCVTVAETIRTLRDDSSVVANRSVMAEIEDGEEVAEEGEVEEIEKEVPQAEEKQVQAKVEPFKLSSECYDQINAYLNSVPPMDGFQFLFPDRNDPASIEELLYNPPPEVLEIQLGDETSRRKNYKGLPEYWKFSHGIEPYETKEEVPILGLYSKILDTLKQHKVLNR